MDKWNNKQVRKAWKTETLITILILINTRCFNEKSSSKHPISILPVLCDQYPSSLQQNHQKSHQLLESQHNDCQHLVFQAKKKIIL